MHGHVVTRGKLLGYGLLIPEFLTDGRHGSVAAFRQQAGVAVVPLSACAEQDAASHMIRLCFAKRDETIDAGVEAMAKARKLMT